MSLFLNQIIEKSTAHRLDRQQNADLILEKTELFEELLHLAFDFRNPNHFKACWTLELVLEQNLELLFPHLDFFLHNFKLFENDSAMRSISKITMFLSKKHFNEKKSGNIFLKEDQINAITELGFDKIITPETKVASKAYLIRALFFLGFEIPWIHAELKLILLNDYHSHSAAYQAVAKEILKKLK
ncbi:MAG: hypothetical protein ACI7YS_08975 [Flavobacterium sp.]